MFYLQAAQCSYGSCLLQSLTKSHQPWRGYFTGNKEIGNSEQLLRWGLLVVSHPWLVILFSLLLCGGLSGGLLFWQQETDQELLWTPYGSPVRFAVTLNRHK